MKKQKTKKYLKQRKKELTNRKAKQEQKRKIEEHVFPEPVQPTPLARRAFQDV